jgi:acetyl/propionyl-CoA carboxylase alpha subunit
MPPVQVEHPVTEMITGIDLIQVFCAAVLDFLCRWSTP